jgi:hypothetical protein
MTISYADAPSAVRADIVAAHERAWTRLADPGTWFSGVTRLAIAAETRHAPQCPLCARRKQALSPYGIDGRHDSLGVLPERMVEQIHRIVTDPGRLTRTWFDSVSALGTPETEYVEIVGIVVTVVSIDTFCRALGVAVHPLPAPVAGEPLRRRPKTAHQRGEAWVPMIHPKDLEGELETPEERTLAAYWGAFWPTFGARSRSCRRKPMPGFSWSRRNICQADGCAISPTSTAPLPMRKSS